MVKWLNCKHLMCFTNKYNIIYQKQNTFYKFNTLCVLAFYFLEYNNKMQLDFPLHYKHKVI